MPDFNKGDFTQQGVAGHVNANLRLNEKRLVNIDLTSNEEAEGCTITGTVKDLLNDKVYGIGSGVSGNIEITENGENINVAPYATATVNVAGGGGDWDNNYIEVTATCTNASGQHPLNRYISGDDLTPIDDNYIDKTPIILANTPTAVKFLYNPTAQELTLFSNDSLLSTNDLVSADAVNCEASIDEGVLFIDITDVSENASISITFREKGGA